MIKIDQKKVNSFCNNMRKSIIYAAMCAGTSSAHIGGALSSVEIIGVLFSSIMKTNYKDPINLNRDRFVLSKGHGCLSLYAALLEKKFINKNDLKNFEKNESDLLGHPVINKKIGIEFSNGSLGMGLSLGIGVAISLKKKNLDNRVFVLMGDGECNEGSVWEAAMFAPNFYLNNICLIVDKNNFQQTGKNKQIMNLRNLSQKWKSFGWDVISIDGHNVKEIANSLKRQSKKPLAIIANTIKGKGFREFENNNDWHHKVITQEHYKKLLKEIK